MLCVCGTSNRATCVTSSTFGSEPKEQPIVTIKLASSLKSGTSF